MHYIFSTDIDRIIERLDDSKCFGVQNRVYRFCEREGITTLGKLVQVMTPRTLRSGRCRDIGKKSVDELERVLRPLGLTLGMTQEQMEAYVEPKGTTTVYPYANKTSASRKIYYVFQVVVEDSSGCKFPRRYVVAQNAMQAADGAVEVTRLAHPDHKHSFTAVSISRGEQVTLAGGEI